MYVYKTNGYASFDKTMAYMHTLKELPTPLISDVVAEVFKEGCWLPEITSNLWAMKANQSDTIAVL